jgi:hypothetical protein
MKKRIVLVLILGMTLTFAGCLSTALQPTLVPLGRYDMVQVRSDTPVALLNVQKPGPAMIKVGTQDTETNLSLWSFQAIASIGGWLTLYKVPVNPEATKKIKVSIVEPRIHLRKHLPCAEIFLKIETETGLEKMYPAEGCAASNNRAIGYAISYAVIDMIRDRDITDYIEQKPAQEEPEPAKD